MRANSKNKKRKVKRRLKIKNIIIFLLFLCFLVGLSIYIIKLPIKNIYIYNNNILSDQEIITIAKIENYPATIKNISMLIESRLKKNKYIKSATVQKKGLTQVHITIEENYPLFVNRTKNKMVLLNGLETSSEFSAPTLINIIPDTIYDKFVEKMTLIKPHILKRISEIQYAPDEVENEKFLFHMNDDNYVYITLNKITSVNSYLNIIKNFNNKKGILYLDYGNHFEIIE